MDYTRKTDKILFFIFCFQIVDKHLLRSIGFSYDYTGRIIKSLEDSEYIKTEKIEGKNKEDYITLTEKGKEYIIQKYNISDKTKQLLKKYNKGNKNKYRQYKFASIAEILSSYFPNFINDYIKTISNENESVSKTRENKINKIRNEIENRREDNRFLISAREMRSFDLDNLKNISGCRAFGVANFNNKNFIIYNHNRKKMRARGDFEEKYLEFVSEVLNDYNINAIHFGQSFKVATDCIAANQKQLNFNFTYIYSKYIFEKQFFIPLTYNGMQQLKIFTIDDFRKKAREAILLPDEIERSKSTIYDGVDSEGNLIFIGFECDLNEIEKFYDNLHSNLKIYCFPFQANFYHTLFGEYADIQTITIKSIFDYIK